MREGLYVSNRFALGLIGVITMTLFLMFVPVMMSWMSHATEADLMADLQGYGYTAFADADDNFDVAGDLEVDGDITAGGAFYGDGSHLTGISASGSDWIGATALLVAADASPIYPDTSSTTTRVYLCNGTNDGDQFRSAKTYIGSLSSTTTGRLQLTDGSFYLDLHSSATENSWCIELDDDIEIAGMGKYATKIWNHPTTSGVSNSLLYQTAGNVVLRDLSFDAGNMRIIDLGYGTIDIDRVDIEPSVGGGKSFFWRGTGTITVTNTNFTGAASVWENKCTGANGLMTMNNCYLKPTGTNNFMWFSGTGNAAQHIISNTVFDWRGVSAPGKMFYLQGSGQMELKNCTLIFGTAPSTAAIQLATTPIMMPCTDTPIILDGCRLTNINKKLLNISTVQIFDSFPISIVRDSNVGGNFTAEQLVGYLKPVSDYAEIISSNATFTSKPITLINPANNTVAITLKDGDMIGQTAEFYDISDAFSATVTVPTHHSGPDITGSFTSSQCAWILKWNGVEWMDVAKTAG